jgi:hypothetical protein
MVEYPRDTKKPATVKPTMQASRVPAIAVSSFAN